MLRRIVWVPLIFAVAASAAGKQHGAFKPVVAQQRITYIARDMSGGEKVLSIYEGQYLRMADGSELATLGPPNQKATEARLRLGSDGTTYKLDFKKKTATLVATEKLPLLPKAGKTGKAHEKIEGRVCDVQTVKSFGVETGTSYRETKHDLLVRLVSYFGSKEDQVKVVMERYNINTKTEPDASFFAIPGGWTVIAPKAADTPRAEVEKTVK